MRQEALWLKDYMIFIPLVFVFMSFYLLYATSKRSNFSANKLVLTIKKQGRKAFYLALVWLLIAWVFFMELAGVGAGTFYMLSSTMTLYGTMVLFYPLFAFIKNK